jgi:hypothetical protein
VIHKFNEASKRKKNLEIQDSRNENQLQVTLVNRFCDAGRDRGKSPKIENEFNFF